MNAPHPVILLIDQLDVRGGTELHVLHLALALEARGHRVAVWTFLDGKVAAEARDRGLSVSSFNKTGVLRLDGVRLYRELEDAARAFAGDAPVVLQSYHTASDLLAPVLARRLPNLIAISTRRDMGFIRKPVHDMFQRGLNGWVSRVLVVSEPVRWIVALREGVDPRRIEVIPNGVDAEVFHPARTEQERAAVQARRRSLGLGPEAALILDVGSLKPIKGHGALVVALERLRARGIDAHLAIAGGGRDAPLLEAQARRAGLEGRVHLLGECRDVAGWLQAADVFALASHSEGFSNAVLEAMAVGLPVVVTDVGGNREAVTPELGVVTPVGDVPRLTEGLARFCLDPVGRREAGAAARRRAIERYGLDRMVDRYLASHREALGQEGL